MPNRFALDPARVDEFIEDLCAPENSLRDVASKWGTTAGALSLFLATPEGLAIVAAAEIATAVHIRLQAQALLADVAQSMVYIVREYSREERRIPFSNDLKSIKLVELRRANARRAGHLLFRLAHYNPAPIRSYTVNAPVPPVGGSATTGVQELAPDFVPSTGRAVAADIAQTCVMPKRPLGHGDVCDEAPCGTAVALDSRGPANQSHACAEPQACHTDQTSHATDVVAASATADVVAAESAQTCVMPKRPLGHGETNDKASSCFDELHLHEDGLGSSSSTTSEHGFSSIPTSLKPCSAASPSGP